MAIIHSLKCFVPLSLVVPLLSLAVTHCYLLSLVVIRCITRCHSLSLVTPLVFIRWHLLSLAVLLVVILYHLLHHSLSLDVPLACLFINDHVRPCKYRRPCLTFADDFLFRSKCLLVLLAAVQLYNALVLPRS